MAEVEISKAGQGSALSLWKWAVTAAWRRRETAVTRKAMAGLTADQLTDIGYSEPPRPILKVKPGLIANLMSMR